MGRRIPAGMAGRAGRPVETPGELPARSRPSSRSQRPSRAQDSWQVHASLTIGCATPASAAARARMAWLVDLSERGVLEPVREQGLLAEDFDAGSRGRQAARQDEEQVSRGSADGDARFAVDALDSDYG